MRILPFLLFLLSFPLAAQTVKQTGYVRTVGRPDNRQGTRLSGALIRVSGQHNTVQSGRQGTFTLLFTKQNEFRFSSIRLTGYDLQEREVLGRRYAVSATVPVEIVLVPQSLKHELEERVRKQVETNYRRKLRRLEAQKNELGKDYEKKIAQLEAEYDRRDQLVNDMVERYAATDYAQLSPFAAQLNAFIEAGELERADSLLATVDVARLETDHAALQQRGEKLRTALAKNERAEAAAAEQLMTIYKGKSDIFRAQFDNDSAAYYLEKVALLDTTNINNVLQTGVFLKSKLSQFDRAMVYYQMALRNSRATNFKPGIATSLNNMSVIYSERGKFDDAITYVQKALDIDIAYYGEQNPFVATDYNNLGLTYSSLAQYDKALEMIRKALTIRTGLYGEKHDDVAASYLSLGKCQQDLAHYDESIKSYTKALDILLALHGEKHEMVARTYNHLGVLYNKKEQYALSLEMHNKALAIYREVLGENHAETATAYGNLAGLYILLGRYEEGIEIYRKTLAIEERVYGPNNHHMAITLSNIAAAYTSMGKLDESINIYKKNLPIVKACYGENHPETARALLMLGTAYLAKQQYAECISLMQQARSILISSLGERHAEVASTLQMEGAAQMQLGHNELALEAFKKSVEISTAIYGELHSQVAIGHTTIATILMAGLHTQEALQHYQKALYIFQHIEGNHADIISTIEKAIKAIPMIEAKMGTK